MHTDRSLLEKVSKNFGLVYSIKLAKAIEIECFDKKDEARDPKTWKILQFRVTYSTKFRVKFEKLVSKFWIHFEAVINGEKASKLVVKKNSKSVLYANSNFKMPEKPKKKDEDKKEEDENKKEEPWNLAEAEKVGRILIGHMTLLTGDGKKDSLKVFSQERFKKYNHHLPSIDALNSDTHTQKKFVGI